MRLAFQNEKRGGAEFTLAANHIALAKAPAHDCPAIQLQKCAGNSGEYRQLVQFFWSQSSVHACRQRGARDAFVRKRARRARHHTLAAGNARGIAHRRVQIKRDARGISLAHAAEDEIILDLVATPDAAVAQDASVVVHGNRQRRIVFTAGNCASRETWSADSSFLRERFQFAIAGILLACARCGVIRHQKFQQSPARGQNFLRIRLHLHAGLDRPHTSSAKHTGTGIHYAQPANAHRRLTLQMAKSRNRDAI